MRGETEEVETLGVDTLGRDWRSEDEASRL